MDKKFSNLCTPAKIYFAIAVISTIVALFNGFPIIAAIIKLVFASIWTFVLSWLCSKGYKSVSWFLVLLPFIMIALAMFGFAQKNTSNAGKEGFGRTHYSSNTNQNNKRRK